ncbi:YrhK family protein [Actinopolyspora halophila]|uniref:YrhK family protein n=1 Tax=Actinopolyspora halophila TaxID=1850 RepID=UPI0003734C5F|nr:YrhK family protein [Actinopolyspora halophila]
MSTGSSGSAGDNTGTTVVHIGHDELVIRQRYEVVSIINDLLIGLWFVLGSAFLLDDALDTASTWLFVVGSVELLIRPTIRLARRVHLARFRSNTPGTADAAHDF